jgi:hypothetical protein
MVLSLWLLRLQESRQSIASTSPPAIGIDPAIELRVDHSSDR